MTEQRWLDGIIDSKDMGLGRLRQLVMDKEAWRAVIHGVRKSRTRLKRLSSSSNLSYGFSSSHIWMCELDYKES